MRKRTKKVLSFITAAALSVSAFAGFTFTASAKTVAYSNDWESATAESGTGFSDLGRGATELVTNFEGKTGQSVDMHNAGSSKGSALHKFTKVEGAHVGVSYDLYLTKNQTNLKYAAIGTDKIARMGDSIATAGVAFAVGNNTAGNILINNSADTGIAAGQWVTVDAILDFGAKTAKVTVTPTTGTAFTKTEAFLDTTITEVSGVTLNSNRGVTDKAIYFDNLEVSTFAEAAITVPQDPATVSEGTAVIATVADAKAVTATSSDDTVATVSYNSETGEVSATSVKGGKVTVTITATSDEDMTITKTLEVISGTVTLADVDVKYVYNDNGTEVEVAEGYQITDMPVGNVITASGVTYQNIVLTDDYRYKNPTVADYTVVDGTNTLKVVYGTRDAAVSKVTAVYKLSNGTQVATAELATAAGLYVGDETTVISTNYVKGSANKIYAVGTDFGASQGTIEADGNDKMLSNSSTPVNSTLISNVTLAEDSTVEYTVSEAYSADFYAEGEEITNTAGSTYATNRYIASGGKMAEGSGAIEFYTVPATGYYQVVLMTSPMKSGTAVYANAAAAEAAQSYNGGTELGYTFSAGQSTASNAFGAYTVKTTVLTEGDKLTLKGFGSNGKTNPIDYVLVRRIVSGEVIGDKNISIADKARTASYAFDSGVDGAPTWSVSGVEGVTIDAQTGVLTVAPTATAGTATIKAELDGLDGELDVTIAKADVQSAEISGAAMVNAAEGGADYSAMKVIDQFGVDISKYVNPSFSIDGAVDAGGKAVFNIPADKAGAAVCIKATYSGGKLKTVKKSNVTLTAGANEIEAATGTVVMLWDSDANMVPIADKQTVTAGAGGDTDAVATITTDGHLTVLKEGSTTITADIMGKIVTKDITIGSYSKIVDNAAAGEIDLSNVIDYGASTYTVTFSDGSTIVKPATNKKVTLEASEVKAGKMEIVPNYKFNFSSTDVDGFVTANAVKANGYGFTSAPTISVGTGNANSVQADGVVIKPNTNAFEVDLPDGRYDMTFYKADTNRTHIKVNGLYTIPEADYTDGDGAESLTAPGSYTQKDVIIEGGVAKITADEWGKGDPKIAAVEITRKSDLEPRKTHIWIAGDSTVTNYRPTPSTRDDWALGTRRTGWGQLFQYCLDDSVIVDDYAHSGDYSVGWYNSTFPSVLQKAQPGDYFFVQFGINDRADKNDCPQEKMAEYLGKMVDECRAKGVIPVLITPQICGSQYGSVDEHAQSTGSGNAGWFNQNKEVSKAKDVLLIDLADLSGKLWAEMGKTWVHQAYMLYNHTKNEQFDAQHMSYQGAKIVARLVATEISRQKAENTTPTAGESFAGIPVNATESTTFTYNDAADNNAEKTTAPRDMVKFIRNDLPATN